MEAAGEQEWSELGGEMGLWALWYHGVTQPEPIAKKVRQETPRWVGLLKRSLCSELL